MNDMMSSQLSNLNPPWVYLADIDGQEFCATLGSLQEAGYVVVELDCSQMRNLDQLFDAFASAAQFPSYFGKNWPAFDECLADLEWLPASGYVFVLRDPQQLLANEPVENATFWRILAKVAAEWAEPVSLGEWWDREGIPFHIVLEAPHDMVRRVSDHTVSISGVEAVFLGPRI